MLRRIDHAARSTGGASLCVDLLGIRSESLPIASNARPKPDAKNAIIGVGKVSKVQRRVRKCPQQGQGNPTTAPRRALGRSDQNMMKHRSPRGWQGGQRRNRESNHVQKQGRKSHDSSEESSWKKCPTYDGKSFSSGLAGGSKAQPRDQPCPKTEQEIPRQPRGELLEEVSKI